MFKEARRRQTSPHKMINTRDDLEGVTYQQTFLQKLKIGGSKKFGSAIQRFYSKCTIKIENLN